MRQALDVWRGNFPIFVKIPNGTTMLLRIPKKTNPILIAMQTAASANFEGKFPSFAGFVSSRLSPAFLTSVRPLIASSYEEAFAQPATNESDLPYRKNLQPHDRNRRAFEQLHSLAQELGLHAEAKCLENGYYYLEIMADGLTVHVKHQNNYQSLKEQMVKADYRRQMTTINAPFGQMPLFQDEKPTAVPDEAYVILFFADSDANRSAPGSIFFVMPSNEEGNILASCEIEQAISYVMPRDEADQSTSNDNIDLPSKRESDEEEKAQ